MTESDSEPDFDIDAQLDAVEYLLELHHGDSIRFNQSQSAHAYATSLDMLEKAREGKYRTDPQVLSADEHEESALQYSRASRRAGWAAATLSGQHRPESQYTRAPGLLDRLFNVIRDKLGNA